MSSGPGAEGPDRPWNRPRVASLRSCRSSGESREINSSSRAASGLSLTSTGVSSTGVVFFATSTGFSSTGVVFFATSTGFSSTAGGLLRHLDGFLFHRGGLLRRLDGCLFLFGETPRRLDEGRSFLRRTSRRAQPWVQQGQERHQGGAQGQQRAALDLSRSEPVHGAEADRRVCQNQGIGDHTGVAELAGAERRAAQSHDTGDTSEHCEQSGGPDGLERTPARPPHHRPEGKCEGDHAPHQPPSGHRQARPSLYRSRQGKVPDGRAALCFPQAAEEVAATASQDELRPLEERPKRVSSRQRHRKRQMRPGAKARPIPQPSATTDPSSSPLRAPCPATRPALLRLRRLGVDSPAIDPEAP